MQLVSNFSAASLIRLERFRQDTQPITITTAGFFPTNYFVSVSRAGQAPQTLQNMALLSGS
jgi:hypothetical protein